jgi:hypothetical protein
MVQDETIIHPVRNQVQVRPAKDAMIEAAVTVQDLLLEAAVTTARDLLVVVVQELVLATETVTTATVQDLLVETDMMAELIIAKMSSSLVADDTLLR